MEDLNKNMADEIYVEEQLDTNEMAGFTCAGSFATGGSFATAGSCASSFSTASSFSSAS
jgi:hypothetical protein